MGTVVLEEYELLGDAKYRSYVTAIDKALKSFESTSEWADLISALGKLNKVLLSNARYQVIPRRLTVSKRLAQCMHPALPSGVHLKALETYDLMLRSAGPQRLGQELFLYSAGLFPLLAHAAMNVRPALLALYETHFLPLGERLRPGLNGFLIGVLPGLEEGSDHYDRTDALLLDVCLSVEKSYFYGSLWKCVLCNPAVRLAAINFIISHYNRRQSMEDQLFIIGTDINCMVQGLCAALQDTSVLVQRSALELLLLGFPLHSCQLVAADRVRVCTAAVVVLLRRDMSLNRRLFAWLFGSDGSTTTSGVAASPPATTSTAAIPDPIDASTASASTYFYTNSCALLLEALKCLFSPSTCRAPVLSSNFSVFWPYRILVSLMDKPEITTAILDDILIDVFRSLYLECSSGTLAKSQQEKQADRTHFELVKTANLLFSSLEPDYLWGYVAKSFHGACVRRSADPLPRTLQSGKVAPVGSGAPTLQEVCILSEFLLEVISMDSYMETEHLPDLLHSVAEDLREHCSCLHPPELKSALVLCSRLLSKVQPSLQPGGSEAVPGTTSRSSQPDTCLEQAVPPGGADDLCSATMMANCVASFQRLFLRFVELWVLVQPQETLALFGSALLRKRTMQGDREKELHRLLEQCLRRGEEDPYRSIDLPRRKTPEREVAPEVSLELRPEFSDLKEAYACLCQLLVELSSFPASLATLKTILLVEVPGTAEGPEGTGGLPDWLRQLLMLSCFAPDQDLLISTTATVLELLELSRTAAAALEPSFRDVSRCLTPGGSQATLAIVVVPMVRPSDLSAVLEQTRFVRVVAGRLWELLEPHREALHLRAVELLQLLHNVAPEGDGACEDVLCRALSSEDEQEQTEAQKRFSILWNLSRNLKFKSTPSSLVRSFDRCLFQMLHCLSRPWGPQRAASQVWLNHSLLRGDLARLLEPPMMVLLHPDTARISVQHVSVHSGMAATVEPVPVLARDEASSSEARIFAISSVGGNVIYHVDKAKVAAGAVAPLASVNPEKRVLALTSIVGPEKGNGSKLQVVTRSSKVDVEFPPASLDSLHQMSLFVNPFGSLTSLTNDYLLDSYGYDAPDLSNATRIHGTSLRKSSFDEPDENAASDREDSAHEIVRSILDEIVDLATSIPKGLHDDDAAASDSVFHEESKRSSVGAFAGQPTAHPLHSHLLLYCQVFDSQKTLYALGVLKLVVESNPRAALCSMATTSVSSSLSQRGAQLQTLLARHRKSIFGNNFHGEMAPEALSGYRSSMFLEVLVSACLYFVRSYYPSLPQAHLTAAELSGNRDVRLLCCELLRLVFSEMVAVVRDSGRSFAVYLGDLLMRCKVQKALLHCLVASVYGFQQKTGSDGERAITTDIIEFNEKVPVGEGLAEDFQETFQVYLLQLIAALIIFEDRVAAQMGDDTHPAHKPSTDKVAQKTRFQPQMSTLRYQHGVPIPCQAMFGTATLTALRQQHKAQLHSHWLSLVMCALPFAGKCLTQLVLSVASQVCSNLEAVVSDRAGPGVQGEGVARPPDYLISLVEGLTLLCHYCLLDGVAAPAVNPVTQQPPPAPPALTPSANVSQIIYNLIHVFSNTDPQKDLNNRESGGSLDPILSTRRSLLSNLPRILAALVTVWEAVSRDDGGPPAGSGAKQSRLWIMGAPKVVKQHILSFLSPISLSYGSNFMAAVAVVWYERRKKNAVPQRKVIPQWSPDQLLLVELVSAIKVLPMDSVVQVVRQVLRQPPPTSHDKKKRVPLEVSVLQFFLAYVQHTPGTQLLESWSALLGLWKDGLQLTALPLVQFHLLGLLNEFVQRAPLLEDKKDQKDLQDITQKVIEACSTVASACLEQTTWLRRNLAVRPGPQPDILGSDADPEDPTSSTDTRMLTNGDGSESPPSTSNFATSSHAQYSVQALSVLAEFLAPVLDVVYVSEEKEKVVPLLSSIMCYVTPYLRNRRLHNVPSFRACSQLVSSLSSYQYTRKAWKRDALELLLDAAFFQMDQPCMAHWRSIVDHLMTHDKTTFRDFLARFAVTQSGSLNIFSSKEQEYESRAQLLKRLAFILFCSEPDQYQRYMPDIQERLAESLKLSHVPAVQAQVFLCFRVLLLRMSPHQVTSLWPGIITELVQAFLQIEQELSTDSEAFGSHLRRLQGLDSSWAVSNGLNAHNHPAWLQLYLSACKLLDLAVALPADMLPQFQMYRWAFIGDNAPLLSSDGTQPLQDNSKSEHHEFVPHIMRLAALMNKNNPNYEPLVQRAGHPFLTLTSIKSLYDMQGFFNSLVDSSFRATELHASSGGLHRDAAFDVVASSSRSQELSKSRSAPELSSATTPSVATEESGLQTALQFVECVLEHDFLEARQS
ncbi:protein dopey-1 isoform X6 [Ixodes scapularis]|uniref:protein dopey-1 isoform X6 n=1 Tax=Ixodes scapularis TaxID=6945 RepID=UPI001C385047|nr:protein dopey-1 isoform X6 [Ixodes scapularis]